MKKTILLLLLILLISPVFADGVYDDCEQLGWEGNPFWELLYIIQPWNPPTEQANVGESFIFRVDARTALMQTPVTIPCEVDPLFEFSTSPLGPYERISDPTYTSPLSGLISYNPAPDKLTYQQHSMVDGTGIGCPLCSGCYELERCYQLEIYCTEVDTFYLKTSSPQTAPDDYTIIECIPAAGNSPPTGNFTAPLGPETISVDNYLVQWTASDLDTPDEDLIYEFFCTGPMDNSDCPSAGVWTNDIEFKQINNLIAGDYDFTVDIYDETNRVTIYSSTLTVDFPSVNTSPTGSFISPLGDSAVYGRNYVVEWDAFDADGDSLTYTFYWDSPNDSGSDTTTDQFYAMANMVIGEDYTFQVDVSDGTNSPVTFFSDVLSVMPPVDNLSISALTVTPDVIYGEDSIDVYLEVRNESDRLVDLNVWFINPDFDDVPTETGFQFYRRVGVPANSKQSFLMTESFLGTPLETGDYNVEVFIEGFFSGTRERTNSDYFIAFAYFTVLDEQKAVSLPETNLFFVFLIPLAIALILRRK